MTEKQFTEAAAEFAQTVRETYQTFVASTTAAQERGIKLAQSLVESGIDELKSQAETAQAIVQTLAQQSEKQASALQTIARESAEAYVNFAFAPFAIIRKSFEAGK